jgi:hypothetical protein
MFGRGLFFLASSSLRFISSFSAEDGVVRGATEGDALNETGGAGLTGKTAALGEGDGAGITGATVGGATTGVGEGDATGAKVGLGATEGLGLGVGEAVAAMVAWGRGVGATVATGAGVAVAAIVAWGRAVGATVATAAGVAVATTAGVAIGAAVAVATGAFPASAGLTNFFGGAFGGGVASDRILARVRSAAERSVTEVQPLSTVTSTTLSLILRGRRTPGIFRNCGTATSISSPRTVAERSSVSISV